ncbi:MAG: PQQ-binding-like beta-propeller repeat protein [Planctomycetes bacterium]|nr:PQQ-binding-like beta-propeller repeat protein [Planctomycetota bacterium]
MAHVGLPFARDWRMGLRCLASGTMFVVWLMAAGPAQSQDPGRGPPTDTGPPAPLPPATSPASGPQIYPVASHSTSAPVETADADPWHQNLIRDRHLELRLRAAKRDLDVGQLIAGLSALQAIVEREEDIFLRLDGELIPCGAHALASRWLEALSVDALATYETLYGSQAQQRLAEISTHDPVALTEIVRRYYHTAAGFAAGVRLAAFWSDRGTDELALNWWQRVFSGQVHRERLQTVHRIQATLCCQRLRRWELIPGFLDGLPDEEVVRLGSRRCTVATLRRDSRPPAASPVQLASYESGQEPVSRHNSSRRQNRTFSHKLWTTGLAGPNSRHLETLTLAWQRHQVQYGLPIGTSQAPVLVGDRLVFRDFEGVRAVDLQSGQTLWTVASPGSVGSEISARQTIAVEGNPDPNNVMRQIVGNGAALNLAANERRVFVIERCDVPDAHAAGSTANDPNAAVRPQANLLVAFDVASTQDNIKPLWRLGGRTDGPATPCRGHCFLGAPCPVADRLFVISEFQQQIFLTCVKSTSGAIIWTQALCSVAQPVVSDQQRLGLACTPTYANGIVVCPTQAGVLVAVEALTGTLLWAVSHDEGESQQRQQMAAWLYQMRRPAAPAAYTSSPVIHGTRVFYLPPHSEFIHCVDLQRGVLNWRVRREDFESATAVEYIGAVSDKTVLVVGRRRCRGLDPATGNEAWRVRLGSSPSGHGVRQGSQYVIPLDRGEIVSLDLDSGRHSQMETGARPLGNLIADRDVLISMGPGEITVFQQAGASNPKHASRVEQASAVLDTGDLPASETGASESEVTVRHDPSRRLDPLLHELEQRRQTTTTAAVDGSQNDPANQHMIERALLGRNLPALKRLAILCGNSPAGERVRLRLAELLFETGDFQAAELELLACRGSEQVPLAGRATALLAGLYSRRGLLQEAARLHRDLLVRFRDAEVEPGITGAVWVQKRLSDPTARLAYQRLLPAAWTGTGVQIVEHRVVNEELQAIYNNNAVQLLLTPRRLSFELFDRGRGANGIFSIVNRESGTEYPETMQLPGRMFYPVGSVGTHVSGQYLHHAFVGNFVPLGGVGTLHGLSLLERRVTWSLAPAALQDVREVVKVGPAGPTFCTFQIRQHLFAVDPLDGRLLWHRDDLEGAAGLMHDPFLGILGDHQVLTVFSSNGANYTVYETATGAEIRRGKIDVQTRLPRRALGRHLFHYTVAGNNRRARVWDPLTDRCLWEESADAIAEASIHDGVPPGTKVCGFVRDTQDFAYLTTSGTIRVVDLLQGRAVLEFTPPAEFLEYASELRVFRDSERYYFNVKRAGPPVKTTAPVALSLALTDTTLPAFLAEGDLLVVEASSSRLLWRKPLGRRTLLQMPDATLPVIVSMSRLRRDDQSFLAIDVLDASSGSLLSSRDNLLSDRLLQATYDVRRPALEMRGAKTVIRLEFPADIAHTESKLRP